MFERRTRNVNIFKDSEELMSENERLKLAIEESVKKEILYLETETVEVPESSNRDCRTIISKKRSFEAASEYAGKGKKVCVLNFASATNPGGGVVHGSSAQEESLCRCSTLYPCLNTGVLWENFYNPHRIAGSPLYNDDCVYTPGVIVFKSDISFPERMEEKDWYQVDVLTCAAPNLRNMPSNFMNPFAGDEAADISEDDLYKLQLKRIERIFRVAAANKAEVLILGAFGCGAFCNPPTVVAKAFEEVQKKYKTYFEVVEYAIFSRGYESRNYKAFCEILDIKKKNFQEIHDRISGCVFAGALGDALGYTVEFDSYRTIQLKYGKNGIQKPELTGDKARVSDDTQMTLFTMEGMSLGYDRKAISEDGENVVHNIYLSYLKWFQTQKTGWNSNLLSDTWESKLAEVPEMNCLRAPGNTCLSALASEKMGTIQNPVNNSKGCGGVMRTAPLGFTEIYGSALLNGAKAAAITHGHPLGWIPAGMLSDIVFKIIYGEKKSLKEIIEGALEDTKVQFKDYKDIVYFEQLIKKAIVWSETDGDDVTVIEKELGGGWVGEEALAIAVYCCLKYSDDMKKMLTAAVNHSGDSDSTGAIAGNILGAYLGMKAVPDDWLDCLEMVSVMQKQIDGMMSLITENEKDSNSL